MAFVDFHSAGPAVAARPPVAPSPEATLSPLEWSVVRLARNDRMSSLRGGGGVSKALNLLLGKRASPVLADPRLEALRRTAVLSWHHGYTIPTGDLRAFQAAGFSADQYELMQTGISAARAQGARA
ncbi:hypothetical protein [Glacieibacterium frigidum]|uniref:Uncharacterized protein n=1 Tax=Glacieibacterium frigidum TaxID=2593303 RepID=A0A552U9Q1_9SPHN|nr:hypothetical protein [Glacieibacterium frigidum]TRW14946.1 hypothetical protein FMM06_14895 [Glacieibacterium frigidum]